MSAIIGFDPGLDGAGALNADGVLSIIDMPTLRPGKRRVVDEIELARLIGAMGPIDHAFVELVGIRPGEGAVGAFAFGLGYGVLRGILRAHFIPITFVTPTRWKRAVGIPAGAGKDASRAMAKEMFQHDAGLFARVKDDGRAEAALIALYGARQAGQVAA
jgi:crossover junction endodeoxyribonuclease RuvC